MDKLISFWFDKGDCFNKKWFNKSIDEYINIHFKNLFFEINKCDINDLKKTEELCFGSILIFDQLTRHIYRGTNNIYKNDIKALELSNYYMKTYIKRDIKLSKLIFILFPYRHNREVESLKYVIMILEEYKQLHKDYDNILMEKFYKKTLEELKKIE
jgi:uncharacterized protein (DUF924 family)